MRAAIKLENNTSVSPMFKPSYIENEDDFKVTESYNMGWLYDKGPNKITAIKLCMECQGVMFYNAAKKQVNQLTGTRPHHICTSHFHEVMFEL